MTLRAALIGLCAVLVAPIAEAGFLHSGDNLPKPASALRQMGDDYSRKSCMHIRKTLKKDQPGWGAPWKQIGHQPPIRAHKPYLR